MRAEAFLFGDRNWAGAVKECCTGGVRECWWHEAVAWWHSGVRRHMFEGQTVRDTRWRFYDQVAGVGEMKD